MENISLVQSRHFGADTNQFLSEAFQYQTCPHCQRRFFEGKLQYHLKLCKPNQPMTKSPLRKAQRKVSSNLEHHKTNEYISQKTFNLSSPLTSDKKIQKCQYCQSNFPKNMLKKHEEKCTRRIKPQPYSNQPDDIKYQTNNQFGLKQSKIFPRIGRSARQNNNEKKRTFSSVREMGQYTVRVREQLSCFQKALQVQKVQCSFCYRKFSKEASLRHIPICENLHRQKSITANHKNQIEQNSLVRKKYSIKLKNKKGVIGKRKKVKQEQSNNKEVNKELNLRLQSVSMNIQMRKSSHLNKQENKERQQQTPKFIRSGQVDAQLTNKNKVSQILKDMQVEETQELYGNEQYQQDKEQYEENKVGRYKEGREDENPQKNEFLNVVI